MRYIVGIALIMLGGVAPWSSPLSGQEYVIDWMRIMDSGIEDYGEGVAVDGNGNVYITGYIYNGSNYDWLTIKYDSQGNIVWSTTYDASHDEKAYDVAVDNAGFVYVTGSCYGNKYLTIKYDEAGNVVWLDTLSNGTVINTATAIAVDNNGNAYVTGRSVVTNDPDFFTVKYDANGNRLWTATFNGGNDDYARDITVDARGRVYVVGYLNTNNRCDFQIVVYDSSGNELWSDVVDNGGTDYGYGVAVDGAGHAFFTGASQIISDFDYFMVEYDTEGLWIRADTMDNGSADNAYAVAVDNHGNSYITGNSQIGLYFDAFTVKYDSLLTPIWFEFFDSHGYDFYPLSIAVDDSGNIYVAGYRFDWSPSNKDYFLIKYTKYKDAGLLCINPPYEVYTDSLYEPEIEVANNSYEDSLTFAIAAMFLNSAGSLVYADTQTVTNLSPGESTTVFFQNYTAPSTPQDISMHFFIITPDMDPENDTLSDILHVISHDVVPPVIDSAIAYEGSDTIPGIDADDYVIIYFSETTNRPDLNSNNINSVLSLSGGHTWLDGSGNIGPCVWNETGDQLRINLTVTASLPTIAVGDTITADGTTIRDLSNNPCSSSALLGGSFGTISIDEGDLHQDLSLDVRSIYRGTIILNFELKKSTPYRIFIYEANGRLAKRVEGAGTGSHSIIISNLPPGVYFISLNQGTINLNKKVILLK